MELELTNADRVLAVAAHPDDMEYGASTAVAKWTAQGIEVSYLLLTRGEAGISGMEPAEAARVRSAEQRAACDVVGVSDLVILDFPDGLLEHGVALRRAIAGRIREVKPTVLLTQNFDLDVPWGINHADHRAAGLATVDAARDAANEWIFPECGPAHQASTVLIAGHPEPNCAVRVGEDEVARGAESLARHREYLRALPEHGKPEDIAHEAAAEGGKLIGAEFAIAFRQHFF